MINRGIKRMKLVHVQSVLLEEDFNNKFIFLKNETDGEGNKD
jgi:hypothetical protein